MTISAAKSSNFLSKKKHELFSVKERNPQSKNQNSYPNISSQPPSIDNLELSQSALEALKNIQKETQELLKENPEYSTYFINKELSSPLSSISLAFHFLNKAQKILNDSNLKRLKKEDHKFALFYEKVDKLNMESKRSLKKIQEEIRSSEFPTYRKLIKSSTIN